MSSERILKKVTAKMRVRPPKFVGARRTPDEDREAAQKYEEFEIGLTNYTYGQAVGLLSHGYMSHMIFYVKDLEKAGALNLADGEVLYFDAGHTRSEIAIEKDEWERVLAELQIKAPKKAGTSW